MTPAQRAACVEIIRVLDQFRDARILHGAGWRDAVSRWTVPPGRRAAFDALLPTCEGDEWPMYAAQVRAAVSDALDRDSAPATRAAAMEPLAACRGALARAAWEVIAAAGSAP